MTAESWLPTICLAMNAAIMMIEYLKYKRSISKIICKTIHNNIKANCVWYKIKVQSKKCLANAIKIYTWNKKKLTNKTNWIKLNFIEQSAKCKKVPREFYELTTAGQVNDGNKVLRHILGIIINQLTTNERMTIRWTLTSG